MLLSIGHFCDSLMAFWLTATPIDYCRVSTLVVVMGWILSRKSR